jgi:hypothetical protein
MDNINNIEQTDSIESKFAEVKNLQSQLASAVDAIEAMIITHEDQESNSFTRNDDIESGFVSETDDDFEYHGSYESPEKEIYEVMLSDDGESAKLREAKSGKTTNWLEIKSDKNFEPFIDPKGFNISMERVFKAGSINEGESLAFTVAPKKIEGKLPDTGGEVIKNAATKHIVKGLGASEPKKTVGKMPETGGEVIKNAATKEVKKSLGGEALKGVPKLEKTPNVSAAPIKNAATKDIEKGLGASQKKESVGKLPETGGQSIKNAATKDIEKGKGVKLEGEKELENPKEVKGIVKNAAKKDIEGGKTGAPSTQNIEKQPTSGMKGVTKPATKDMSTPVKKSSPTPPKPKVVKEDLDDNDGTNVEIGESLDIIKNAATKDIEGGKTEVKGKSSLKNMDEEESWMKTRAGANGKVYEAGEFSKDEENNKIYEVEDETEKTEGLNEAIRRFKQIMNY